MTVDEKMEWLDTHSYSEFLATKVGLSKMALLYFQQRSNDFFAIGIEGISCSDARACALPGMEGMGYRRWTESRWPTSKSRMFTISRTVTPVWPDC
jgi:hypothetical protein